MQQFSEGWPVSGRLSYEDTISPAFSPAQAYWPGQNATLLPRQGYRRRTSDPGSLSDDGVQFLKGDLGIRFTENLEMGRMRESPGQSGGVWQNHGH